MKRNTFAPTRWLFISLAILVLTACTQSAQPIISEWDTLMYETQPAEDGEVGIDFSINILIPKTSGNKGRNFIRQQLTTILFSHSFMGNPVLCDYSDPQTCMAEYTKASTTELLADEISVADQQLMGVRYQDQKALTPVADNNTFLTFKLWSLCYEGGAHEIYGNTYYTFDAQTGRMVHDSEFWNTGTQHELDALLIKSLVKLIANSPDDLDLGLFYTQDMHTNDNFLLTPDSIYYTYHVYEIAPFCYGEQQLGIAAEDAMPYLSHSGMAYNYWKEHKH